MSQAQETKTPGRPWHLWLIAIIGGLWNSIGVMSFMLTQLKVEAVMSQYPPAQREYFESFPLWAVAFWAIGVFGGVIGCLLTYEGRSNLVNDEGELQRVTIVHN